MRLTRVTPLHFAFASYLVIGAAVFAIDDPAVAPSLLFVIPIALFTCAIGVRGGLLAAALALVAVVAKWETSAIDVGADAYMMRAIAFCSIPALIAWAGGTRPSPAAVAPPSRARVDSSTRRSLGLSRRELEVLQLLALGHTNPEIADRLVISVRTVEGHRARLQRKIGRTGRAELVSFALERELIGSPN